MSDTPDPAPETEDDALKDVAELGGDAEIMASLPDEGSPITTDTEDDALDETLESPEPPDIAEAVDAVSVDVDDTETPVDVVVALPPDLPPDDDIEAEPASGESPATYTDFLDVDAALASVASLGEMVERRETDEAAEMEAARQAQAERLAAEPRSPRAIQSPQPVSLHRGQLASVVPALALIAVGAWLTFAVTAPGAVPASPLLLVVVVGGAVLVTLLSQWLASGRWSRGVFFFTVLALLVGGGLYFATTQANGPALVGPLVLGAVGVAFALTGLVARPADRRLFLPGLVFVVAALVAFVVMMGGLPGDLLAQAAPLGPALLAVVAVLWLLPVILKRRG